jgi:hypothetical protein
MPVAMSDLNCYIEYHSGWNFMVYIHITAFIIETGSYFLEGWGVVMKVDNTTVPVAAVEMFIVECRV